MKRATFIVTVEEETSYEASLNLVLFFFFNLSSDRLR